MSARTQNNAGTARRQRSPRRSSPVAPPAPVQLVPQPGASGLSFTRTLRTARGKWVREEWFVVEPETYWKGQRRGIDAAIEMLELRRQQVDSKSPTPPWDWLRVLDAVMRIRIEADSHKVSFDRPSSAGAADGFLKVLVDMLDFAAVRADTERYGRNLRERLDREDELYARLKEERDRQAVEQMRAGRERRRQQREAGDGV